MEKIFIGMPVFNGEKFITGAIQSIINQSYLNWELLISDNDSSDNTANICREFVKKDDRIRYVKQAQNIGAGANFLFLLKSASAGYFMWAASDDIWQKEYLEKCLVPLILSPDTCLSFCNIKNIDSFGREIKSYSTFARFVNADKPAQIAAYLFDPENCGKANLIYGIYRLSCCRKFLIDFLNTRMDYWFSDLALVFGILMLPYKLYIEESCLFFKRIADPSDNLMFKKPIQTEFQTINGIPLQEDIYLPYFRLIREVASGTAHAPLVNAILDFRTDLTRELADYKYKLNIEKDAKLQSLGVKALTTRLVREILHKIYK